MDDLTLSAKARMLTRMLEAMSSLYCCFSSPLNSVDLIIFNCLIKVDLPASPVPSSRTFRSFCASFLSSLISLSMALLAALALSLSSLVSVGRGGETLPDRTEKTQVGSLADFYFLGKT